MNKQQKIESLSRQIASLENSTLPDLWNDLPATRDKQKLCVPYKHSYTKYDVIYKLDFKGGSGISSASFYPTDEYARIYNKTFGLGFLNDELEKARWLIYCYVSEYKDHSKKLGNERGKLRQERDCLERSLRDEEKKEKRRLAHLRKEERAKKQAINLAEQQARLAEQKAKQEAKIALAQSNADDVRSAASTVKRKLEVDHDCPYCGLELGPDYHADHIYPVAKGGKSTFKNMVNVCRTCNSKKVALTLGVFCRKFGLNRDAIELSLDALGKDF